MNGRPEFLVRNGYIVPLPGWEEEYIYQWLSEQAAAGNGDAIETLNGVPVHEYEMRRCQQISGVWVQRLGRDRIRLQSGKYPSKYRGSSMAQLQKIADDGDFTTQRVLGWIMRQRITNPDLEIHDISSR